MDLQAWKSFLSDPVRYSRPFFQFDLTFASVELDWYTDASTSLGMGGVCGTDWFIGEWDLDFIQAQRVSINYLELFAVTVGVLSWLHQFSNQSIVLFCDNMSVVHMINNTSSKCRNCMVLIRLIVLQGMLHNVQIKAKHVPGVLNQFSDRLSRLKYREFWALSRKQGRIFNKRSTPIPDEIWPMNKIWLA